jgi:4-diphosphocytidyl-2-C-methyl-D-erythritol kinase
LHSHMQCVSAGGVKTIESAWAKVNLALHILGRRADGYHLLDSIVVFADIADQITVSSAATANFTVTGPFAADLVAEPANSVLQAEMKIRSLAMTYGIELPAFAITLDKHLPIASGIGGGSADAAATLRAILRRVQNPPAKFLQEIEKIALSLGADVPVCLRQDACRMQGVGEIITAVKPPLPGIILLINPGVPLPTKSVFSAMKSDDYMGKPELDPSVPARWRNDMKAAAIQLVPEIGAVLAAISSESAFIISNMSGSGATCFGLADDPDAARAAAARIQAAHPEWWLRLGKIINLE